MARHTKKDSKKLGDQKLNTILALVTSPSNTEAAKTLKISESALYWRIKEWGLQEWIDDLPHWALNRLKMGSIKAADTFIRNLDNTKKDMQAAAEILDRVGVTKKSKDVNINTIQNVIQNKIEKYQE